MTEKAFEFKTGGYRDFGRTDIGGNISVTFWAKWDAMASWSRIIDFGNGP
jgi:hypothetical protein